MTAPTFQDPAGEHANAAHDALAQTPMAETVEIDEMTLAEAAAQADAEPGPLTGTKIARMVDEEERRADEPEQKDNLQDDPDTATCPQCGGYGETLTGSLVPDQVKRQCPECLGAGWVEKYRLDDWQERQKEKDAATTV